jgi:hypothetical protein
MMGDIAADYSREGDRSGERVMEAGMIGSRMLWKNDNSRGESNIGIEGGTCNGRKPAQTEPWPCAG